MFRSSEISLIVIACLIESFRLLFQHSLGFLMLKDVPISPRLQPIHNHYEIIRTTCKPSSWSLQNHHKLILTFCVFFSTFLQFETKFHVNALFVIHDLQHTLKHSFSQLQLTTAWLHLTSWNLSHTVTKVQRAASHIEDPCLSVGSHSAAAFTVLFDHSGKYI